MNLNANLPLDCHEFARSRFANSRNDEFLVILTCLCHTLPFLVILSVAKYPRMVSFLLICVNFSPISLAQNDNAEFLLCASNAFCCGYALLLQRAKTKKARKSAFKSLFCGEIYESLTKP